MKEILSGKLEVGDKLTLINSWGESYYPITRVTKMLAMSLRKSDGYEHKFKRVISGHMSHPARTHCMTKYKAERL